MNIRDEFVNDATAAIQRYIEGYSKFDDVPIARRKDIQHLWLILHEKNPVRIRKKLEKKLASMPNGVIAFFMFDMKKLKNPLVELLSQDKYQKEFLKYRYEKEIASISNNEEAITKILDRMSLLENKVFDYEERIQNLEAEIQRLVRENEFLTQTIKQLHEQKTVLQKEKKDALTRAETAEAKLLKMEQKYQTLLEENKKLNNQLRRKEPNASSDTDFTVLPRRISSAYS